MSTENTDTTLIKREVSIKILGTSDVHGRVLAWNYAADEEDKSGSYAQISTLIKKIRRKTENVILVEVGDAIQDNWIEKFAMAPKHPIPEILNYIGYDIFVPGNHEFNFGMPTLSNILRDMKFKKLTANLYYNENAENDTNFSKDKSRYLDACAIIEREGVKIGIIGLSTPMSAQFEEDTGYLKDFYFVSPINETKRQIKKLKKEGVNAIVVVAHMGIENENGIPETGIRDLANAVPEIDVIVAGHMHQNVPKEIINGVLITEPHRYGTFISEIDLRFAVADKKISLISKNSTTIPVKNEEPDVEIEKIYKPFHNRLCRIANEIIGETLNDMVPKEKFYGVSSAFIKDSGLSSFITDVELYYSRADVVSFAYNYENVRLDKGEIKRKDIVYNYRYTGGDVTIYQMTGKQLKDYMEWSADYFETIHAGDTEYHYNLERVNGKYITFDIFGGVKYKIDLRNEKGDKIIDLALTNGTKITDDMKLKVGMNTYRFEQLARKGGIFDGQKIPVLWASKEVIGDIKGTIQNMMVDYIRNVKNGIIEGKSHNNWEIIGL